MVKKLIKVFLLLGWWCALPPATGEVLAQFHDPLYDICLTGTGKIAVGYYGTILLSEDGGDTVTRVPSGTKALLVSVCFPDADHGWVVGDNGAILATSDGGRTWKKQDSGVTKYLMGVSFVSPRKGWVVGELGTILYTSDGGASWDQQQSGEEVLMLEGVRFLNEKKGFVVGEFGTILGTSDGGNTWKSIFKKEEEILDIEALGKMRPTLYSVDFWGDEIGVAVGVDGFIMSTRDGGEIWTKVSSPTTNPLYRVKFIDGSLYAVGQRGTLLLSTDQGRNWTVIPLPKEKSLFWYYGIAGKARDIFLVGEDGAILKQ